MCLSRYMFGFTARRRPTCKNGSVRDTGLGQEVFDGLCERGCPIDKARIDHLLYLYDYFFFSCGDRPSLHRTAVFYEEAFPKDAQEHGTRTACERFTGSAVHVGGEVGYKHRATT